MGLIGILSWSSGSAERLIVITDGPSLYATATSYLKLSRDGRVLLGTTVSSPSGYPIIWTEAEGWRYLRADGGLTRNRQEAMRSNFAWHIAYDGSVIVGGNPAYRWQQGIGVDYSLPPSDVPWIATEATAVSWDGQVIYGVGRDLSNRLIGWRWRNGVAEQVPIIGAWDCSADGSCAVNPQGRWCEDRGWSGPGGVAISADGRVVVNRNWRWMEGRGYELVGGWAFTLSGDGRIVAGAVDLPPDYIETSAFWWREGIGFEDLNYTYRNLLGDRYRLERVLWMSADGRYLMGIGERKEADGRWYGMIYILDTQGRGDVDRDGCIDDADLLAVLFAFGRVGSDLSEDVNGDGVVEIQDLLEVLFYLGNGC
ncbi:hypothetical protein HRbin15_01483 [bacterium HR15]|nr:hypothetical protein HRbin15_01483 [bacterium HR15]